MLAFSILWGYDRVIVVATRCVSHLRMRWLFKVSRAVFRPYFLDDPLAIMKRKIARPQTGSELNNEDCAAANAYPGLC